MGFQKTNFSPAALTSLSLSVITGDRQDPLQGCTMCHSDEVPTLREYSKSWGQIKIEMVLKTKNNLIICFKISYILMKNFSLSPLQMSKKVSEVKLSATKNRKLIFCYKVITKAEKILWIINLKKTELWRNHRRIFPWKLVWATAFCFPFLRSLKTFEIVDLS